MSLGHLIHSSEFRVNEWKQNAYKHRAILTCTRTHIHAAQPLALCAKCSVFKANIIQLRYSLQSYHRQKFDIQQERIGFLYVIQILLTNSVFRSNLNWTSIESEKVIAKLLEIEFILFFWFFFFFKFKMKKLWIKLNLKFSYSLLQITKRRQ